MLLTLALTLLLSLGLAQDPAQTKDLVRGNNGARWALLIGVDQYDDDGIADLSFSGNDARAMARVLVESGVYDPEHVVVMTPDQEPKLQPTAVNIRDQLDLLRRREGAESVLFFFSGHGAAAPPREGAENIKENMVFPQDTSVLRPAATGLPVREVIAALEGAHAMRTLIILDACRNKLPPDAKALPPAWDDPRYDLAVGLQILNATRYGDYSYEDEEAQLGRMTRYLVEALQGSGDGVILGARDGVVSTMEMYNYAFQRMRDLNQDNRVQIPTLSGDAPDLPVSVVLRRGGSPEQLADCVADNDRLSATLGAARAALDQRDNLAFLDAAALADCQLAHLTAPLRPQTALAWYRIEASRAFLAGDRRGASLALEAARALQPAGDPRAGLSPAQPGLIALAEQRDAESASETRADAAKALTPVPGGLYIVDSDRARAAPEARLSIVQGVYADGSVQWTAVTRPGMTPPALEVPPLNIRLIPVQRRLYVSAGVSAAASGLCWLNAARQRQELLAMGAEIADPPTAGYSFTEEELMSLRTRQQRWAGVAIGGAALAGALGGAGLTIELAF